MKFDNFDYVLTPGNETKPKVSFVLIDWSVRESFHTLDYMNRQRVDRGKYEIIWIEFYNHRPQQIRDMVDRHKELGLPAPIDKWIVMGEADDTIYHKHVMYNVGILEARGEIVVILDSDAICRIDFVETILDEYKKDPNLALHFEQIRNFKQEYYPFNFPAIDEIIGEGCVNAINGVPTEYPNTPRSLKEDWNIWHIYNYGACLCAKKEDLIRIGGADEHTDYLGYICGPYDMTARLINAGVRDYIHDTHFLYHVWHPNQGGSNNYCGPNNGRGMSTTAMAIPKTGRIEPLLENKEIRKLRLAMEKVEA